MSAENRDWWLKRARELDDKVRAIEPEILKLKAQQEALFAELCSAYKNAQGECPQHVDNGGFMYGHCTHCGVEL